MKATKPIIFWIDQRFEVAKKRKEIVWPINNHFKIKKFCTGIEAYYSLFKQSEKVELLIVSSKDYKKDECIKKRFRVHFQKQRLLVVDFDAKSPTKNKKKQKNKKKKGNVKEIQGKKKLITVLEKFFQLEIKATVNKNNPVCLFWKKNTHQNFNNSHKGIKYEYFDKTKEIINRIKKSPRSILCVIVSEKNYYKSTDNFYLLNTFCKESNLEIFIEKDTKKNFQNSQRMNKKHKGLIKSKNEIKIVLMKLVKTIKNKHCQNPDYQFNDNLQRKKPNHRMNNDDYTKYVDHHPNLKRIQDSRNNYHNQKPINLKKNLPKKDRIVFWLNKDSSTIKNEKKFLEQKGYKVTTFTSYAKVKRQLENRKKKKNNKEELYCIITSQFFVRDGVATSLKNIYKKYCIVWSKTAKQNESSTFECINSGAHSVPKTKFELLRNINAIHNEEQQKKNYSYTDNPNDNHDHDYNYNNYHDDDNHHQNQPYLNGGINMNLTKHHQKNNNQRNNNFQKNNTYNNFQQSNQPNQQFSSGNSYWGDNCNINGLNYNNLPTDNCIWFNSDFTYDEFMIRQLANQDIKIHKFTNAESYLKKSGKKKYLVKDIKCIITNGQILFDNLIFKILSSFKGEEFPPIVVYSRSIPQSQDRINECQLMGVNYIAKDKESFLEIVKKICFNDRKYENCVLFDRYSNIKFFYFPKKKKQVLLISQNDPLPKTIKRFNKNNFVIRHVSNYSLAKKLLKIYYVNCEKAFVLIHYVFFEKNQDGYHLQKDKPKILCSGLDPEIQKKIKKNKIRGFKYIMDEERLFKCLADFFG
ncbi:hypothetical protein M0812_16076 [Anaeramoeba flamelloides]|uniref:Response regulatory domain-containing protein n=1 Tax=Anaeramoeba flamelloides TaxID=1746091 RepID=A0AAV7ZID2_9EUKA|nr:hypothetical protein M0812_16076 [Anaeramoeba flamelloides]